MKRKILSVLLALMTMISMFSFISIESSAASYPTNYSSYSQPTRSLYYKSPTMKGDDVKWLQCALNKTINAKLSVDGSFGPATKTAVKNFQKKYGLSQDGSFGPATRSKMLTVLKGSTTSSSSKTNATAGTSKALSINWNLIKKTGKQSVSGPCLCYAFAYCRDILDGKQHSWTEYRSGSSGYVASCSKAGYNKKYSSSKATVYKAIYDNINNGKPVVINVDDGANKRSSGCHYVAVVGYVNVTNTSSLSASNFLIIDSVSCSGYTTENLGSLGYFLDENTDSNSSSKKYKYYVD